MQSTRSPFWYLLPVFLGIVGGGIVYFILRNSDNNKAKNAIIIGMLFSIPMSAWFIAQLSYGIETPFFVVSNEGMSPALQTYDVISVDAYTSFNQIKENDIILHYSPNLYEQGIERVIVSRVYLIATYDDSQIIRTKGDGNPTSIAGINYPITDKEYIGKVQNIIPQIGFLGSYPTNLIMLALYFGLPIIWISFSHRKQNENVPSDITPKKEIASTSNSTKICPLCKSQNILHDMRNSQYRCSDCDWSGYISRMYSNAWYLLPILIGIVGGLIFYLVMKDDDKEKAIKGLIIGIIVSLVSIILYVILIISTGFLF